ncbi:MBOAT, membrane-bound O-acyltransferase family-domain-containing protein [Zopfochytrium polystomum]|nr:MBOAT, membrane-bound O-acyltransferase family-domain-containing protein [Zopfochytrium polystomum]
MPDLGRPLWWTAEMNIYFVIMIVSIITMFKVAVDFSSSDRPEYALVRQYLSQGWILNRPMDNSDSQYRTFRGNLPILVPLAAGFLVLSNVLQRFDASARRPQHLAKTLSLSRVWFSLVFSVVFIAVFNGITGLIKNLLLASISYFIGKLLGSSRWNPVFTWVFCVAALFAADWTRGLPFSVVPGLGFVDQMPGIQSRWWESLRFHILRMISYNMDYHWRSTNTREMKDRNEKHEATCGVCQMGEKCAKARVDVPLSREDYNFPLYIAYVFYVPLFVAGPIITYNDFVAQLKRRPSSITGLSLVTKAARWLGCFFFMELLLHYCYVIAITKSRAWMGTFRPLEVAVLGYINLKHIWLKLLLIWRFFGWWAAADGIETVENMHRCMSNNYSVTAFWRSWHRSFNRWLIRYVFVPLGGSENYVFNMIIVFTFVAVWHDLDLNLLVWGWLVAVFILPEMLAKKAFPEKAWKSWPYYRHLCGVGAVLNILMMITVNLIGFAGGVSSVTGMIAEVFSSKSELVFLLGTFLYFFSISEIMFEIRASERRKDPTGTSFRD